MAAVKKYAKSGAFSSPSLEDKLKTQANSPSGHANIRGIAKSLGGLTEEALAVIASIMRKEGARDSDRLGAAKYIVSEMINSLAQMDRQKLMVKQIAMLDVKIKQTEIHNNKVEDELNSEGDDDVTKEDGAATFTLELIK
jgi:hypothetical protein